MATATEAPASSTAEGLIPHTHFRFQPAVKEARPVRALIDGPPGSGRTLAALRMAAELGQSIAVIDTERGRSRQYAHLVPFQVIDLADFHPANLALALYEAAAAGADVTVIDCWSAFWTGPGGHLEQVQTVNASARAGGNPNFGWNEMRPLERQMLEAVMCHPGHLIATLRDKVEVVLRTDADGRQVPTRVGLRPEQQASIEYDVDFAATMLPTHELLVSKSSAPGLDGEPLTDPAGVGKTLRAWADEGTPRGPHTGLLHRAYDPNATYASLSQLAQDVQHHRASGMAALDRHGLATTLADVISLRLKAAYKREQEAARTAAIDAARQPAPEGTAA
ncbi:AAA family ATPase [Streptomyces sp. LBUM 1486]|uniref:AAA family ATPase n=1 Tax=Streptomyces scabiei TaxID=1930 RepID=UPI001B33B31A|nr:AAA family ATPase [Streptomyces sp. LBUM 1486]MBP5918699.1 AAA family ATPase [Streptomyces sp. LBUM 1486]